jgi:hypothetical protein
MVTTQNHKNSVIFLFRPTSITKILLHLSYTGLHWKYSIAWYHHVDSKYNTFFLHLHTAFLFLHLTAIYSLSYYTKKLPGMGATFLFIPYYTTSSQAVLGRGRLFVEVSWLHSDAPHSVWLLWTSDQPDAQTSTWTAHNTHKRRTSMSPGGF